MRTSNRSPLGLLSRGMLSRCLLLLAVLAFVGTPVLADDEPVEAERPAVAEESSAEEPAAEGETEGHGTEEPVAEEAGTEEHGTNAAEQEASDDEHGGEAGQDHGDHEHHPHVGEPETTPDVAAADPDLAIFTAVVFLLLLIILGKFAWGPIVAGLKKREQSIADNIAAAENANAEAHKLLAEYETKLAAAQDQVRAMLDEARKDGAHAREEIVAKAKEEAAAEVARGRREIESATQAAIKEMSEQFAAQAVLLAGKLVHKELSASDHQALINESLDKFQTSQN